MDPKEYVPFLQKLEALPAALKHYEIELYLKRYPRALLRLLEAGVAHHTAFFELTRQQQLFPTALAHIVQAQAEGDEVTSLTTLHQQVASEFGDVLLNDGRPCTIFPLSFGSIFGLVACWNH
jgi:hypothetical protein